jgi:hypothetical protein
MCALLHRAPEHATPIVFKADADVRLMMWSKDDERARLRLGRRHLRRAHLLCLRALPRRAKMT